MGGGSGGWVAWMLLLGSKGGDGTVRGWGVY